jgi:hypothetical protein
MRFTYPIGAAIILLAAAVAWKWLPAHAADAEEEVDLATELSGELVTAEARAKFDDFDIANA